MAKIEVVLFEEDYGTGACIGALRKGPGDAVARIYQAQDGGYYTIVNFPYEYDRCFMSKEKLDEHFKNSDRTMNDEVSYAADVFKAHLEKQME